MIRMLRTWFVSLLILPALPLIVLAQGSSPAGGRLFVASFMTMHDPFFVELNDGLKKAVEAQGDHFLFLDGEHSRENQEQNTLEVLRLKPAAVFLVPATDAGSIDHILAAAKAQGVPVFIVDTDVDVRSDLIVAKIITNNVQAGRIAAEELAEVNPKARIGLLEFSASQACVARVKGFMTEIAKHPGMQVVAHAEGHANPDGVRGVIHDFLNGHPEMDAIFAINDVSAIEALAGVNAAGREGKITVQGVAGSSEGAQLIQQGRMLSSSAQMPGEIGRIAVQAADDFLSGKSVPKEIQVPTKLVTAANASLFIH